MEIYTSYYGRIKKLESEGIVPIAISIKPPRWFTGKCYYPFAPTYAMIRKDVTVKKYIPMFAAILKKLSPAKVMKQLTELSGGRPIALLCYEVEGDFCHRHLVSEWIEEKTGKNVREFQVAPPKVIRRTPPPPSLFD